MGHTNSDLQRKSQNQGIYRLNHSDRLDKFVKLLNFFKNLIWHDDGVIDSDRQIIFYGECAVGIRQYYKFAGFCYFYNIIKSIDHVYSTYVGLATSEKDNGSTARI